MSEYALTIIVEQAPYGTVAAREALELALGTSALLEPMAILFRGPAVSLCHQQLQAPAGLKAFHKQMGLLALYDIDAQFVDAQALLDYPGVLLDSVTALDNAQIKTLIAHSRHVVRI